jgi:hypothetical protein
MCQADLVTKGQTLSLSGVGAHHQNGVAERAIQTVTQWAHNLRKMKIMITSKDGQFDGHFFETRLTRTLSLPLKRRAGS